MTIIINSIRPMDNSRNIYIVVIDGVEMTLGCADDPVEEIKKLFGVK